MNNPNSFILVGLYDQAGVPSGGACPSDQYKITGPTGSDICVSADHGTLASAQLTKQIAQAALVPSVTPLTAHANGYYVLASIQIPGGSPQGQQSQAGTLQYFVDVRARQA
ncbi:MAG: hypothetical protein FJ029_04190 [Actinobacteria bacterium]|nr:hypothetical protein [Actinomycetota bacterium]